MNKGTGFKGEITFEISAFSKVCVQKSCTRDRHTRNRTLVTSYKMTQNKAIIWDSRFSTQSVFNVEHFPRMNTFLYWLNER